MDALLVYLAVSTAAFATVVVTTPAVAWAARRGGATDQPGGRHIHLRTTPTLGGLAIFAGLLAGIGVASRFPLFRPLFAETNEPEAIVLASLFIVVIGVIDDTRGISAPAKLAAQIVASGLLVLFGVGLRYLYLPAVPALAGSAAQTVALGPEDSAVLTIIGLVAMMNAVNLVDGLDGLAAGIVTIGAAALFVYTQSADGLATALSAAPLVLAAVIGACLGFLVHNFNPASIFMGDTGSMLLGLLIGTAGVLAVGSTVTAPTGGTFAAVSIPVLVPVFVLAVPFLDTAWTIIRRLQAGRAVFSPDKQHLHYRLMEIGHSHKRAVLIMYYWSALLAFAAVGGSLLEVPVLLAVLAGGVGLAVVVTVGARALRAR